MALLARSLRCTLVWLAGTAGAACVVAVVQADARALLGGVGDDLETALVRAGSAVLLGCVAWAWLATTSVVVQAARGRTDREVRGVPAALRRLVLLGCGLGLAAGLASPATADPGLSGLPLPDRATGGVARPVPPAAVAPEAVTVRPGDSLWTLARAQLGPHASTAEVDQRWRALYRLNRPLVGPDPDLIRPGQQLRLPAPPQETP